MKEVDKNQSGFQEESKMSASRVKSRQKMNSKLSKYETSL
jgi:hypothetical protein